jgi:high-affinity Fe2+/Pb2+ permease
MVRCKNAGGAPSDGNESPPHLTEVAHGKHKKITTKKRKRTLTEAEIAQAVADTADIAEREGVEAVVFTLASVAFTVKDDSSVQRPLRR